MSPQPDVESRVITAMLTERGALEACDSLELGDLTDLRYRAILTAIRELQETQTPISLLSVADAIAMRDLARETHVAESVDAAFMADMLRAGDIAENANGACWVWKNPPYRDFELLRFDLAQLRRIARSNA